MRTFISIIQDLITVRADAFRAKILVFSFDRTPTFWAHIGRRQTIGRKIHFLTTIWTDPFFFQFRYHFHTYPLQFYCKAFYCLPLILFKSNVAKCQNENISLHSYYESRFLTVIPFTWFTGKLLWGFVCEVCGETCCVNCGVNYAPACVWSTLWPEFKPMRHEAFHWSEFSGLGRGLGFRL